MNVKVKMKVTIKGETFLKTATVKCQSQRLNFGNKKRRSKTPLQITPRSLSQSERQVEGGGAFPGGRSEPGVELTRGQTTLNWKVPSRSEFTQGQSSLRVRLRLRDVNWKVHSRTQFTQGQSSLKVRDKSQDWFSYKSRVQTFWRSRFGDWGQILLLVTANPISELKNGWKV